MNVKESRISPEEAASLDFSGLIGALGDENTPSGGRATIERSLLRSIIPPLGRVLDVGCATGFTSFEISLARPDLNVIGLDRNLLSIEHARQRIARRPRITFHVGDATRLPYVDEAFDFVFVGNVPSFSSEPIQMLDEARRVTRAGGWVVAVPIYFVQAPPAQLLTRVASALGAPLPIRTEADWMKIYSDAGLVVSSVERGSFRELSRGEIDAYVEQLATEDFNSRHHAETLGILSRRLATFFALFNENNRYTGFSLVMLRRLDSAKSILFGTVS